MLYRLGLDIGISSIGWAVLALRHEGDRLKPYRILDLGVRIFEKAEGKSGASLALPRRQARSARRRLRRHRHRLWRIKQLIESQGIMKVEEIEAMYHRCEPAPDVYRLRVAALDRRLNREELVRVLIHLAQRRGFKSNRKSELKDKETGRLLAAVEYNTAVMHEKGYRTIAEMFVQEAEARQRAASVAQHGTKYIYTSNVRNKAGEYRYTVSRDLVLDEIEKIFDAQRRMGNSLLSDDFVERYVQIFASQRNFDEGPGGTSPYGGFAGESRNGQEPQSIYERMIGLCTFEGGTGEKRAPRSSYSFEKFNLLTKLINLRIAKKNIDGSVTIRSLTAEEREWVVTAAHQYSTITYSRLRKILGMSDNDTFAGLTYGSIRDLSKTEAATFVSMRFYHDLRKALRRIEIDINQLPEPVIDRIGWILSVWKSDDNRRMRLTAAGLPREAIEQILTLNGSSFCHLSFKALRKIIPFLEQGYPYDKACTLAGYDFQMKSAGEKGRFLPPFPQDGIQNPVVRRALAQAVKIVNAVIREYGSPQSIHIELAREMSKNFDERAKVTKMQADNQRKNEQIKRHLREILGVSNVSGNDIVKYKLYEQQKGHCLYSTEMLEVTRLLEPGYVEIDHIIPYGVSFDDSYNNKALVKAEENRQKGNRTPMEYLRDKPTQKAKFLALVESLSLPQQKKNYLLLDKRASDLEREGFRERNLNDTRYITKAFLNHIDQWLLFDDADSGRRKRVVAVNGAVTAYMRKYWGLSKERGASDKHHAMDAVVVACIGDDLIQRVSKYDKFKRSILADSTRFEKTLLNDQTNTWNFTDRETGEVFTWDNFDEQNFLRHERYEPWPQFREELLARLSDTPSESIRSLGLSTYDPDEHIRPIFVSRMPVRKVSGAAHMETVRSPRADEVGEDGAPVVRYTVSKVDLKDLTLGPDGEIKNYYRPQDDPRLYATLKDRLIQFNGDAEKAFREPVFKISRDGTVMTPVKKVKIHTKITVGVLVHAGRGIAENASGSMVRIDVFEKDGKYYYVPIYVADALKSELPMRLATAHKPYSQWRELDNTYKFKFSLYKNDLVMVKPSKKVDIKYNDGSKKPLVGQLMYYVGADISSANINLKTHDGSGTVDGLGLQSLNTFEKYVVDYLGRVHRVAQEKRLPFHLGRGTGVVVP